jgi:hypothetical protein
MPRYVIERKFDPLDDEGFEEVVRRANALPDEGFADVTWEHSHMCVDESGTVTAFCVYVAPNEERLREHAEAMGSHVITQLFELVEDLTPDRIRA